MSSKVRTVLKNSGVDLGRERANLDVALVGGSLMEDQGVSSLWIFALSRSGGSLTCCRSNEVIPSEAGLKPFAASRGCGLH